VEEVYKYGHMFSLMQY